MLQKREKQPPKTRFFWGLVKGGCFEKIELQNFFRILSTKIPLKEVEERLF